MESLGGVSIHVMIKYMTHIHEGHTGVCFRVYLMCVMTGHIHPDQDLLTEF